MRRLVSCCFCQVPPVVGSWHADGNLRLHACASTIYITNCQTVYISLFFYSRHLWLKGRSVSNFGLNRMRKCCKSLWYNCFYCTTQRQKNKPQDKRRWHRQTWWTGPFDCALHAKRPPILVWVPLVALGFPIKLVEPEGVLSEKGGGGVCVCGCVTLALWTMSFLFLADRQMFSSARILSLLIKGAQRLVPVVLCTCVYGCTG